MYRRKDYFQNEAVRERNDIVDLVIKIITDVIATEKESEEFKITLAENIRFDISDAFRTLDYNIKGYIYPEDVYKFMRFLARILFKSVSKCAVFLSTQLQMVRRALIIGVRFLEFIIPRYDKEATMQCVARKSYAPNPNNKLSFFLEEFLSKLIFTELQYLEQLEVEKMKLAQMCEWKFMTVFRLVANNQNIESIDKHILDQFLARFGREKLTDRDYLFFMTRFNRNNDKLIQREEFNDAIFPNGFLLESNEQVDGKDDFENYIKPRSDKLDQYLGNNKMHDIDDEDVQFRPEDHKIKINLNQKLFLNVVAEDDSQRKYLQMDAHLANSREKYYQPTQPKPSPAKGKWIDPSPVDPNSSLKYFNIASKKHRFGSNYSPPQNESPILKPLAERFNQASNFQQPKPKAENFQPIEKDLIDEFVNLGNKGNAHGGYKDTQPYNQQPKTFQQPQLKNRQDSSQSHDYNNSDEQDAQSQLHNYINQPSNKMLFLKQR